jgi:fumarate reductase flavoprotein subunit
MSQISAPGSESIDVAIVGGGLSGLVTAVRASMAGLRAIVFEKGTEERYLCASRLTGGVFHVCMTDIRTDPQKLAEIISEETGGFCSPELADLVAGNALRAVTWLTRAGVRFIRGPYPHLSFMLTPPNVVRVGAAWRGRGGDSALRVLEGQLVKCGGQIRRGHRARGLLSSPLRDCIGLEVEGAQGISQVRSSAVVLADGGFQSSVPALSRYVSPAPEKVFQRNARRSFGNALEMAEVFAPAIVGMDSFYGHVLSRSALHNEKLWPYPWLDDIVTVGVIVDGHGRRFCDEGLGGVAVANRIARLTDPLSATVICDAEMWAANARSLVIPANPYLQLLGGVMHRASDLTSLARMAGLPDCLVRNVEAYNASVTAWSGMSLSPFRTSIGRTSASPIAHGPFYAIPACAGITYTMGGPVIDNHARMVSRSGQPIGGLYIVGSASGGIEGGAKPGYVGGLVKAAVTGLAAAEHIIETRLSLSTTSSGISSAGQL